VSVKPDAKQSASASAPHTHDPYFGLSQEEIDFMNLLGAFVKEKAPASFKVEVTNGVSFDRLTLDPAIPDEVFMIRKKPKGNGKRKVEIDIMSEEEAKYEASKPDDPQGAAFADPCCWWVWDGVNWICVAYGN
jgi:hypothetical protein